MRLECPAQCPVSGTWLTYITWYQGGGRSERMGNEEKEVVSLTYPRRPPTRSFDSPTQPF